MFTLRKFCECRFDDKKYGDQIDNNDNLKQGDGEKGKNYVFPHFHSVLVERPHQNGRLSCTRLTHIL